MGIIALIHPPNARQRPFPEAAKAPTGLFPGHPSQRCLCHNHCIAKGDRQQNVNQQKNSTAIFCRQVWEPPDIAQANRGAGCRQDKAKFAGK